MGLETLEQKLKNANYHVLLFSNEIHVGANPIIDARTGIGMYDSFCRIYQQGENFVVDYTRAQLPEEQEFSNEAEVIHFIKKKFPL